MLILANIPLELLDTDIPRRKLANRIQAQFGCEPRVRESGKWKGKTKLSKRGNMQARTALYQAATCAILNDRQLEAIYQGLRARGKPHKVAVYDIGRRLIRRLVAVLKSDPQCPQTTS
jgi:transposase